MIPLILFCLPVVVALPASFWKPPPDALPFPADGFTARVVVKASANFDPIDRDCAFNATIYVNPRTASMKFVIDPRPGRIPGSAYPCANSPELEDATWPTGARTVYISRTPAGDTAIRHVVFENGTCMRADTAGSQTAGSWLLHTQRWYSGPSDCQGGDAGGHPSCSEYQCDVGGPDHRIPATCLSFSEDKSGVESYSIGWSVVSNGTFAGIPVESYNSYDGQQSDVDDGTEFSSLALGFPVSTFKLPDACNPNKIGFSKHDSTVTQRKNCHSVSPKASNIWCTANCNHNPSFCPSKICRCTDGPAPAPAPPPQHPLCIHHEDSHKCYEACSDGTKFGMKGFDTAGGCEAKYDAITSKTTEYQCADGVTNIKYCEDSILAVTVTTKGIA